MPAHTPNLAWRHVWLIGLLVPAASVHASRVVDVQDGVVVEAIVSTREPTRVRIDGSLIRDVFGNLESTSCGNAASTTPVATASGSPAAINAAEVLVECDVDKGEIYLRPLGSSDKPINLFISSPHATYTLLLRRADTPADTLVLRDRTLAVTASPAQSARGASANPIRRLKAMLVAMASDQLPSDIRAETVNRDIPLWHQVRFTLRQRFEGRGLIGEHYVLQNLGNEIMVLAEQEFDRDSGDVAGVAIEHHNLRPGERTNVYVLRFGGVP